MPKCIAPILALLMMHLPAAALAQVAGQVVAIKPSGQVTSGETTRNLSEGSEIASGDIITTDGSGEVQIIFIDETKIVVGRNSALKIDQTLFRADGTARKFATKALGGTFRFISGKSPKQVYKISAPLATMGIRGTEFDFTVSTDQGTDLLVFQGKVQFCNRSGRCVTVPGGCHAVNIERSGQFSQPDTDEEKAALLESQFPLLRAQDRFQPEFRVGTDGCLGANIIVLPADGEGNGPGGGRSNDPGGNPAE